MVSAQDIRDYVERKLEEESVLVDSKEYRIMFIREAELERGPNDELDWISYIVLEDEDLHPHILEFVCNENTDLVFKATLFDFEPIDFTKLE